APALKLDGKVHPPPYQPRRETYVSCQVVQGIVALGVVGEEVEFLEDAQVRPLHVLGEELPLNPAIVGRTDYQCLEQLDSGLLTGNEPPATDVDQIPRPRAVLCDPQGLARLNLTYRRYAVDEFINRVVEPNLGKRMDDALLDGNERICCFI